MRRAEPVLWTFVDLVAVIAVVALINLVVVSPPLNGSLVQAVFGIVFVCFIPGYAFVAMLFPETGQLQPAGESAEPWALANRFVPFSTDSPRPINGIERVGLSFGVSIALVPLVMVGLSIFSVEVELLSAVSVISVVTGLCTAIAAVRRWRLPVERRFRVPIQEWFTTVEQSTTGTDSLFEAGLNVALAIALLLSVGIFSYAVVAPPSGEQFTDFYLLTETGEGELVAASFPEALSPGEPARIHIAIENNEQETVEYFVIVQLQRVTSRGDGGVTNRIQLDRFSTTLAQGESSIQERVLTVSDELTGDNLRLTFLLYKGSVPANPTRDTAYRSLHLWVDVQEAGV